MKPHRRGYHVHAWTIDDPDEMTRPLDLGADGIMTDRPHVLKDVLLAAASGGERGQREPHEHHDRADERHDRPSADAEQRDVDPVR